jgi:hypothetical protein
MGCYRIYAGALIMAGFFDKYINPFSKKHVWSKPGKKFWGNEFFTGSPEIRENVSTLLPEQEPLRDQAIRAGMEPGAGGAFGTSADYYRNLMSDNPADLAAYAAPELRRYNQDIVPGISEQFAGMGAGGLSSSGFRNAQLQGATDLSERIAAIRAGLRQSGAQGLTNIGQIGLGNYSQNMTTQQGSPGFFQNIAPAVGQAAVSGISQGFSGGQSGFGKTSPYGGGMQASPRF